MIRITHYIYIYIYRIIIIIIIIPICTHNTAEWLFGDINTRLYDTAEKIRFLRFSSVIKDENLSIYEHYIKVFG
jgi:hypothetical protein